MHLLDSVTTSVNLADVVTVCCRADGRVTVSYDGKPSPYENDVVKKALGSISDKLFPIGLDVAVEKRLPECAGIGGSSADAAAVIFLADKLYGIFSRGYTIADAEKVGSDVPLMLSGGFNRLVGTGANIQKIAAADLNFVLLCGGKGVSTAECFALFDKTYPQKSFSPSDNDALTAAVGGGNVLEIARFTDNALSLPAEKLCSAIAERKARLMRAGAASAFMTGSGSGVVGLFEDKESAKMAAQFLKENSDGDEVFLLNSEREGITLL